MDFNAVLDQVVDLLRSRQRVTYRTLKRQFNLDDAALEDLKEEFLFTYPQIADEDGRGSDAALAEAHYQQALALADELGMRPLQAHCHLGLGTLYAKLEQREQVRTELSYCYRPLP